MANRVGQQLGNYSLLRLLGQGGFAEVYLAEHVFLNTQAAIKVLHTRLTEEEQHGFLNEARTIARLLHPNIVRVLEYGVESGVPFLVMDYAPNGNLRQRHPKGIPLSLPSILSYVRQMAAGLQYAHNERLIHRDVKPENMLIGRNNEVLLGDFGVALIAQSSRSQSVHEVAGTVMYMAPEQIQGRPRFASDQYALAVVVYEWLCGDRPFHGSFTEVAAQHALTPPPPLRQKLPTISPYIEQVVMTALQKDPALRFASVQSFANAFEQACQAAAAQPYAIPPPPPPWMLSSSPALAGASNVPTFTPQVKDAPPAFSSPANTYKSQTQNAIQQASTGGQTEVYTPSSSPLATPPGRTIPSVWPTQPGSKAVDKQGLSRVQATLLIGLAALVIVAGTGLFYYLSTHTSKGPPKGTTTTPAHVVPGGTWSDDLFGQPDSLVPGGSVAASSAIVDQALWAPLFVGDSTGAIQPGLATVVPTVANSGVSSDLRTWTFHLRPNLKWSDGQPLDARDVDFTWKLWTNPQFVASSLIGINLITSTDVSADNLTITFHLKQPFADFLAAWTDGINGPLPAHHYSSMAPASILTSSENLDPPVVSGPFKLSESQPNNHYTLVRNPNYYRASEGLPYLDSIKFHTVTDQAAILQDLQTGSIDSAWFLDVSKTTTYLQLTNYALTANPNAANFEALYFNLHNPILGKYPEVRQAIAMAIDYQTLISAARRGQAEALCTDHGPAFRPGFEANAPCPKFDTNAANALLEQNGWVKGNDGVRTKNGMRLEFEYSSIVSADTNSLWRADDEFIVQSNLKAIGIQLDIQNYPAATFFGTFLPGGKSSPSTGAQAGKYDIAEFENSIPYQADDAALFACNQFPPAGINYSFYCNPSLDQLYVQEESTLDPAQRQQIFNQIHKIYLTDFPFIVLYSPLDIAMHKKTLHNYNPGPFNATETINVWEWWCDNGHC